MSRTTRHVQVCSVENVSLWPILDTSMERVLISSYKMCLDPETSLRNKCDNRIEILFVVYVVIIYDERRQSGAMCTTICICTGYTMIYMCVCVC